MMNKKKHIKLGRDSYKIGGEIPVHKFKGGQWRIDREEFRKWWSER